MGWATEVVLNICRHILRIDFFFFPFVVTTAPGVNWIKDVQEPERTLTQQGGTQVPLR